MAPPDGSGPRRLPTLSWDSIVDDGAAAGPPRPDADAEGDAPTGPDDLGDDTPDIVPVAPLSLGTVPPAASADPGGHVDPGAPAVPVTPRAAAPQAPADVAPPAPPAPPPTALADRPVAEEQVEQPRLVESPPAVEPPVVEPAVAEVVEPAVVEPAVVEESSAAETAIAVEPPVEETSPVVEPTSAEPASPVEVSSTPPQPVVAPIGTVAEPAPAAVSTELPEIREATPVTPLEDPVDEPVEADRTGVVPVVAATPEYRLPTVPQPDQSRIAPPPEVSAFSMDPAPSAGGRRRRKSRGGLKAFLALVVLGGLVAAGIVFGRPYLFPDSWDPAAEPYAVAVEEAAGAEYVETLALVSEPTAAYTDRMSNVLTGDWTAEAPEWRALGLVSGQANAENVTLLLEQWHGAVHDPADGQVYGDAALDGPQFDAEVTRAFASALLDQQYAWSEQQPERTLDDAAWTLAEVQRQSAAVQEASSFPATVEARATAALSFLPPVLAYKVLAPATYSAFERPDLPEPSSGADNPLRQVGVNGPGPLGTDRPVPSDPPVALEGDTITGTPAAVDRSFWYLVLAGYLDTRTAYEASEAVVESSMTLAERVANRCVYGTFSGGDVAQTATLRSALEAWVAAVPLEMSASFTVLPDGTLQLTTCDPGSRFENGSRIGVGRELIGWRMAEVATTLAVLADGGTSEDAAAAWTVVEASNVPVDLANLPFDTAPADAAAAAVAAVDAVLPPAGG